MNQTVIRYANAPGQVIKATFEVEPQTSPTPTVSYYSDTDLTTLASGPTALTMVSALVWDAPVPDANPQTLYIDYAYKAESGGPTLHSTGDVLILVAADVISGDGLYTLPEFDAYLQGSADEVTATLLRDLVSGMIGDIIGSSFDPDNATSTVKAVALLAAARAYRNPLGLTSTSESIDDYSVTNRWEDSGDLKGLYLTDAEISRIRALPRARSVVLQVP